MYVFKVCTWFNSDSNIPAIDYFLTFKEVQNHYQKFDDKKIKILIGEVQSFKELL